MKTSIRLVSVLLLFFAQSVIAQTFEEHISSSLKTDPKLDLRLDSRNSFITEKNVKLFGIKIGLDHKQTFRYGIGFNYLKSNLEKEIVNDNITSIALLRFYTFSPYVEYIFFKDNKWELSVPVQMGFGGSYYHHKDESGYSHNTNKSFVMSYEPAITAQYRLLKYLGPSIGIGYRLMIVNNSSIDEKFTSPVYQFGMALFVEDLYKDIFKKEE